MRLQILFFELLYASRCWYKNKPKHVAIYLLLNTEPRLTVACSFFMLFFVFYIFYTSYFIFFIFYTLIKILILTLKFSFIFRPIQIYYCLIILSYTISLQDRRTDNSRMLIVFAQRLFPWRLLMVLKWTQSFDTKLSLSQQ